MPVSLASVMVTMFLLGSALAPTVRPTYASRLPGDGDQFGMSFDTAYGSRTGYMPSSAQGLSFSYSISTTGVTCTNSTGTVAVFDTVHLTTTSADLLQGGITLGCSSYPTSTWLLQYEYWDDNGQNHGPTTFQTLSTSTYPSLSGTISIYYVDSSHWKLQVVAAGKPYPYTYGVTGKYINGYDNDWQEVETVPNQRGISFGSSFDWTITYPLFLESGSWVDYNGYSAPYYMLYAYSVYSPMKPTNTLGVEKIASQGVEVFVGSGLGDGVLMSWQVGSLSPVH